MPSKTKPAKKSAAKKLTARQQQLADKKRAREKREKEMRDIEQGAVGAWIECASSAAEALRDRCAARAPGLDSDLRFATLARDVWREHPGRADTLVAILERYVNAAAAHTQAIAEISTALTEISTLPEDQHVHLPDRTVKLARVRAANVMSAKG